MLSRTAFLAPFLLLACTAANEDPERTSAVPSPAADSTTIGDLHYTADLRVMESFPVQLQARMQVHNPTARAATLEMPGGCPLHLLAYRDSTRSNPAWDQGHAIACTLQLEIAQLQPGEQREFTTDADARAILADTLPDGVYYLSVRLSVNDTMIVRPVGEVRLAIPR